MIHLTIWAAGLFALATALVRLRGRSDSSGAKVLWTVALVCYLAHVAAAFHWRHHWSHADAYRHTAEVTQRVTGWHWGGGLYANYAFTLLWIADVAALWTWGAAHRSRRLRLVLAGVYLFFWFNAAVVFVEGATRWLALGAFVGLGLSALRSRGNQTATK